MEEALPPGAASRRYPFYLWRQIISPDSIYLNYYGKEDQDPY